MYCCESAKATCKFCYHGKPIINNMFPNFAGTSIYLDKTTICLPNKIDIPTSRFPNAGAIIEHPQDTVCTGFYPRQP